MDSYREIENMIYQMDWMVDENRNEEVCRELFKHCMVAMPPEMDEYPGPEVAEMTKGFAKVFGPKKSAMTLHNVSNLWVEIDEENNSAQSRCYLTIMQSVPEKGFPLQPVACGVYHDTFKRIDGKWWFATHRLEMKLTGDISKLTILWDQLPLWQRAIARLTIMFPVLQRLLPRQ